MGAMRTYKVSVEVEVEVRTDKLEEVQGAALIKAVNALSSIPNEDALTKGVRSIHTRRID